MKPREVVLKLKEAGRKRADQGDYQGAVACYSKSIKLNTSDHETYNWRGTAKLFLGQISDAIKDYTTALKVRPNYAKAYYNRGRVEFLLGNYFKALDDYNKSIELDPNLVSPYFDRALAKQRLRKYDEAIKDYSFVISVDAKDSTAFINRGNVKADIGNFGEAVSDYDKSIEINPECLEAYFNRGLVYINLKDFARSISDFSKCIELNKEESDAYYHRGRAKAELASYEEAYRDILDAYRIRRSRLDDGMEDNDSEIFQKRTISLRFYSGKNTSISYFDSISRKNIEEKYISKIYFSLIYALCSEPTKEQSYKQIEEYAKIFEAEHLDFPKKSFTSNQAVTRAIQEINKAYRKTIEEYPSYHFPDESIEINKSKRPLTYKLKYFKNIKEHRFFGKSPIIFDDTEKNDAQREMIKIKRMPEKEQLRYQMKSVELEDKIYERSNRRIVNRSNDFETYE